MRVIETNMGDGIDLVHDWNTIDEAVDSGRFEYIEQNDGKKAWKKIMKATTIEEFIENVGYPFYEDEDYKESLQKQCDLLQKELWDIMLKLKEINNTISYEKE